MKRDTMEALLEKLDMRLREWRPETATQVRQALAELIDLADYDVLDLLRSVMDPKIWTRKRPFLRWSAALKMEERQCHERVRITHPA
jgi:hypothetical protein